MGSHDNCSNQELLEIIARLETENKRLSDLIGNNEILPDNQTENISDFKKKYAIKILNSLPDMLTVLSNSGTLVDLISSEETNHVGEPSSMLIGRDISTMLPSEAYHNVKDNLDLVVATNKGSVAHHSLYFDGEPHHYENRIFPLDDQYTLCMCRDITDTENSKHELELVNRKMKLAENIASLSYWYFYSKTEEFEASGIIPMLLGTKSEKCSKETYLSYVHPDDRKQLSDLISNPSVQTDYLKYRIIFNGQTKYLHSRIIQIHEQNEFLIIEGYIQDMTYMEERLQELETLTYAVNKAVEEIYACSLDGTLKFANQQFINRHQLNEPISQYKIYDLESSEETFIQDKIKETVRSTDKSLKYNIQHTLPSGEVITQEIVSYSIQNQSQEEIIWFFSRDISVRMDQENRIKELNYIMDAVLNNIPVYLFVKDPADNFKYLYWNKAFEDYSHIPASKVLGKTDFEVFPCKKDAEKFRKDDIYLLKTGERIEFQEEYVAATGKTRVVNTSKALVPTEKKIPLLIGVSWDITELKESEKELISARLKAEQSDRLKSAFLANMSHEIRTPLNAIVGFSKLIAETVDEEEKQQYCDIIDNNSSLLLQLINDILDISKIEAGTLTFSEKPFNLSDLCEDSFQIHRARVKNGVKLIFENNHPNLILKSDQNRIAQVITNLITNAIKFTEQGEIRFGFHVKNKQIEFYVKDTGCGVPKDKIESVFDRFIKLNNFAQGTGLGLAICKMIVEKTGGNISLESEENVGSTFKFTIPYPEGQEFEINIPLQANENTNTPKQDTPNQKKKILIAEDIESNYLLLKAFLKKHYDLVWAHDGVEAIAKFKECHPDLILMDIKMPNMNGLDATKIIRNLSTDVPIIALTAFAFEDDKQNAFKIGCNDFITKPVSVDSLYEKINKYLELFSK